MLEDRFAHLELREEIGVGACPGGHEDHRPHGVRMVERHDLGDGAARR